MGLHQQQYHPAIGPVPGHFPGQLPLPMMNMHHPMPIHSSHNLQTAPYYARPILPVLPQPPHLQQSQLPAPPAAAAPAPLVAQTTFMPMWPQDVAAPPPPSPDISRYIAAMASAHGVEYSPTRGLNNPQVLEERIRTAEKFSRRKESHVWAAQQAQQEMLLAALDGDVPDPFDAVFERAWITLTIVS